MLSRNTMRLYEFAEMHMHVATTLTKFGVLFIWKRSNVF